MTEVCFKVSHHEHDTIHKIVARAVSQGLVRGTASPGHWYTRLTMEMDLKACHANGCPLDFERLLNADDFNFTHDVCGIAAHMDRETGKLRDMFLPRFASKQHYSEESTDEKA